MRKTYAGGIAAWVGALTLAGLMASASAGTPAPAGLEVSHAWVRVIPGGAVAAAYCTLANTGTRALTVVEVRAPWARHAMLHESRVVAGVNQMRALDRVVVPPGGRRVLAPGGVHVMLHELSPAPSPGGRVPLELVLDDGSTVAVSAEVRAADAG